MPFVTCLRSKVHLCPPQCEPLLFTVFTPETRKKLLFSLQKTRKNKHFNTFLTVFQQNTTEEKVHKLPKWQSSPLPGLTLNKKYGHALQKACPHMVL